MEPADIGKTFRRLDYETKVTGRAQYLADMSVPGMCHGKILRSPFPHARILRINAANALKVPGVVAVITRDDILKDEGIDPYYGPVFKDQTIVAVDKVRHVGDPVAGVAALEPEAAEEALQKIEVEYEELPAILDVYEALKKGAPLLHETIRLPESGFADLAEIRPVEGTNICTHFKLRKGDVEKGFAESDYIFEDTFTLPATQHSFLETHACIASVDGSGRITVWSTTQNPFVVRTQLSNIFKVPVPLVKIQVLGVDTDAVPYDLTTSSSRSTFHMGKAVQLAAEDIKNQLKQIVVQEYGIPAENVEFVEGRIRLPETTLDYKEVLFKRFGMQGGTLVGQGHVKTKVTDREGRKTTSAFWFLGAGAAEVEVDCETGKIKLLKYATAVDVGKAINPLGCRQQLAGAAITGMGQALFEEIVFDNGQVINPNFVDYVLPAPGDMPDVIEPILVEIPHKEGPFGAKGIGETALIPVAPAIANAVFDAVGVRVRDLPIKAEKIFLALEEVGKEP